MIGIIRKKKIDTSVYIELLKRNKPDSKSNVQPQLQIHKSQIQKSNLGSGQSQTSIPLKFLQKYQGQFVCPPTDKSYP